MITTAFAIAEPECATAPCASAGSTRDCFGSHHDASGSHHVAALLDFVPPSGLARRVEHWTAQMLDQVDYAMLLVTDDGSLIHANAATRVTLDLSHPLKLEAGSLRARAEEDKLPLLRALHVAVSAGLHSLVTLRGAGTLISVAIVPLAAPGMADGGAALVILGRKSMSEDLSAQWFGRFHKLTSAESQVLRLLCEGLLPSEVANRQGVSTSTIRTQISSIRGKTGAQNIRALLRQIVMLPPLVGVLRGSPS